MSVFNTDAYELSSDTEVDMILNDLPLELMKENIKDQIQDPLKTNVNYIEIIVDKINELQNVYGENPDAVTIINSLIIDFFGFIVDEIDTRFELDITINDDNVQEVMETGKNLYYFFVLSYRKNIVNFLYNYITLNRKTLIKEFESEQKKKDVTTITLKRKVKNRDDVVIISNLSSITKYIMDLEMSPDDFLNYASQGESSSSYIKNMIQQGSMIGDFVSSYINFIRIEHDTILDIIQTDIRLNLMSKWTK